MYLDIVFLVLLINTGLCDEALQIQELKGIIEKQQLLLNCLSEKVSKLENEQMSTERRHVETVGFTAYLDHREDVRANSVLRFNRVLYNLGNAYNNFTGIFTVPVNGTYMFSFQIEEWDTPEIVCKLQIDGTDQVGAVLFPGGTSTQSGNTAILGLAKGQSVWVQIKINGRLYGESTFGGTSFAGAFLF